MSETVATDGLRTELARGELRRVVASMVRSRVPRGDVDDVVQTTLCAALAANNVPEEPQRRARWVVGIARHKIIDYYRARRDEPAGALNDDERHGFEPPYEARDLLGHLAEDVAHDDRAKQTLEWIVREHGGERLADIARHDDVSATAVRQRVSRLRRRLRARWLPAVAAIVACATLWFGLRAPPAENRRAPLGVARDPFAELQGTWQVRRVEAEEGVDDTIAELVMALAPTASFTLDGSQLRVVVPGTERAFALEPSTREGTDGEFRLVDDSGVVHTARVDRVAGHLTVKLTTDDWRGTLVLVRGAR